MSDERAEPAPSPKLKWESKTIEMTVEAKVDEAGIIIDQDELKTIIAQSIRNKYLLTPQCKITVEFFDFDRTEDAAHVTITRKNDNA